MPNIRILRVCHLIEKSTNACLGDSPDLPYSTTLAVRSLRSWFTHGMGAREAEKKGFVKDVEPTLTPRDLYVPG